MEEPRRLGGEFLLLETLDRRSGPWRPWLALDAQCHPLVAVMQPAAPGALGHLDVHALRGVTGPHVAPVHAVLLDDEDPAVVVVLSARFGTGDLAAVLRGAAPLPPVPALRVVHQVARGLVAVHAAGLVHGRVDAAAVLVDGDPRVEAVTAKVTGFGLASLLPAAEGEVSAARDVRCLGLLLAGLLTGTCSGGRAARPQDVVAPAAVQELVAALTAGAEPGPSAADAVRWVRDVLVDLGEEVEDEPLPAPRPAATQRRAPSARRPSGPWRAVPISSVLPRVLVGAGALGVLVATVLAGGSATTRPGPAAEALRAIAASAPLTAPQAGAPAAPAAPTAMARDAAGTRDTPRGQLLAMADSRSAVAATPEVVAADDGAAHQGPPGIGSTSAGALPTAGPTSTAVGSPGVPSPSTATPTPSGAATSAQDPGATPSPTAAAPAPPTASGAPSGAPSGSPTGSATDTAAPSPGPSTSGTPTSSPSPTGSRGPSGSPSPSGSPAPTGSPSPTAPSSSATAPPSDTPTSSPTGVPGPTPSAAPPSTGPTSAQPTP